LCTKDYLSGFGGRRYLLYFLHVESFIQLKVFLGTKFVLLLFWFSCSNSQAVPRVAGAMEGFLLLLAINTTLILFEVTPIQIPSEEL